MVNLQRFSPEKFIIDRAHPNKNIVVPYWMSMDSILEDVIDEYTSNDFEIRIEAFARLYQGFSYTITNFNNLFKFDDVRTFYQLYQQNLQSIFENSEFDIVDNYRDIIPTKTKYKDAKYFTFEPNEEIEFDEYILFLCQDWGRIPSTDFIGLDFYLELIDYCGNNKINLVMKIHPVAYENTEGVPTLMDMASKHGNGYVKIVDCEISSFENDKRLKFSSSVCSGACQSLMMYNIPTVSFDNSDCNVVFPKIKLEELKDVSFDDIDVEEKCKEFFSFYLHHCININNIEEAKNKIRSRIETFIK